MQYSRAINNDTSLSSIKGVEASSKVGHLREITWEENGLLGPWPMNGENRPLVIDQPPSLRNNQLKFKTLRKSHHHFRGIETSRRKHLKFIERNWKMSTHNQLHLETLGSRLIMPKNLHVHWAREGLLLRTVRSNEMKLILEFGKPKRWWA